MTNHEQRLFGTDGIRGQSNRHPITPEITLRIGKAIARVFQAGGKHRCRALIGKDTRLSGYMLETALTSGLVSMGMDVFLAGPLPTPAVAHLTRSMNATVGIMLTASHNPFDDNGIKIFDGSGFKLKEEIEDHIEDLVFSGELSSDHIRSKDLGKAYRIEDARGRYIEFAKNTIGNQSLEGLKIVLDCANGAAYRIGPWIFRELGAEVIKAGAEPDGLNINNGCGALHPENAAEQVLRHGADAGIAFDGDADRVVFCDADGRIVDGDRVVAMCAIDLLQRGALIPRGVVVTVMSSLGFHEAMRSRGIDVITTPVGDRHVLERMRLEGYCLGGEKSGHLVFGRYATTGDGIIAALQVLCLMKQQQRTLSELADCVNELPHAVESLEVPEYRPIETLTGLNREIERCEADLLGQGRVLVRYSGTEQVLRILIEAQDPLQVEQWRHQLVAAAQEDFRVPKELP